MTVSTRGSMIHTRSGDTRRSKYASPPAVLPSKPAGHAKGAATRSRKRAIELDAEVVKEFGGAWGATFIMVVSHVIVYFLYASNAYYDGGLPAPGPGESAAAWARALVRRLARDCAPNTTAACIFFGFMGWMFVSATSLMPGVKSSGLPVPSEGFRVLTYNCNSLSTWWVTLAALAIAHYYDVFSLATVADQLGPLTTIAVLFGDALSLAVYLGAFGAKATHRMSHNPAYDYFMGAWLNPRILGVDLKMMFEIRVAWIGLFLLTLSAAVKQAEVHGNISGPMAILLCAHFLYTNACVKGEECVTTTWDVFYEKWGWMLIFWNAAGVPLVYSYQPYYILTKLGKQEHSHAYTAVLTAVLLVTYYVWDTCNSQKNRFKAQLRGTYAPREWAFPQLPWGTLQDPMVIVATGNASSQLLVSGWYAYARKVHYTCDIVMALVWGLACGFGDVLPYFYSVFFTTMILHRLARDDARLQKKYGHAFEEYKRRVPYVFVPYVI